MREFTTDLPRQFAEVCKKAQWRLRREVVDVLESLGSGCDDPAVLSGALDDLDECLQRYERLSTGYREAAEALKAAASSIDEDRRALAKDYKRARRHLAKLERKAARKNGGRS